VRVKLNGGLHLIDKTSNIQVIIRALGGKQDSMLCLKTGEVIDKGDLLEADDEIQIVPFEPAKTQAEVQKLLSQQIHISDGYIDSFYELTAINDDGDKVFASKF